MFAEAAIAFGQWDGGWASGISSDNRTQADAQNGAMNACNSKGFNCGIRLNFSNACGALAVQVGSNGYAVASRPDEYSARQSALATCVRMGLACEIKAARCDSVSEAAIQAQEYQTFLSIWRACFAGAVASCDNALAYPNLSSEDRTRLINQRAAIAARQTFLSNWQACFAGDVTSCDNASSYPNLSSEDRTRLINQRAAIIDAKETARAKQTFLSNWQACFTGDVASCDNALSYLNLSSEDRTKLINQRAAIIDAEERRRLQQAIKYITDAKGTVIGALFVLVIARIAMAALKSKKGDGDFWRDVRVEAVASLLTAPVLMYIGAEKELTAVSVPVGLGFSVALLWSFAES
ncbi:MAG: DUF4189 domain-containing protein [Methylocystis sp.]